MMRLTRSAPVATVTRTVRINGGPEVKYHGDEDNDDEDDDDEELKWDPKWGKPGGGTPGDDPPGGGGGGLHNASELPAKIGP